MATEFVTFGASDLDRRVEALAEQLHDELKPLARIAYNFRWSWHPDGAEVFRSLHAHRWELAAANPVRFLRDLWPSTQAAAVADGALMERVRRLVADVEDDLARPSRPRPGVEGPVAFFCAEFGFHESMPIYSGGLGVLAGDILKEASDQALPLVGVGLFYSRGYFHQRLDIGGLQQEYWLTNDAHTLPVSRVDNGEGRPLRLSAPIAGGDLSFQVWRADVGRVPLFLLDADVPDNDQVQRWTTARLYEGNRAVRLAQYGLLGVGGMRVLHALGIEPAVVHLNEGHPALAAIEQVTADVERGVPLDEAVEATREKFVFTTHTPVAAGNETYSAEEFATAFGALPRRLGVGDDWLLRLARVNPDDESERPGMTPLAIRMSRTRNGVSRLHGEVARGIWRPMFPGAEAVDVPITHVTNGAHVATFTSGPMRRLFERYLGEDWLRHDVDVSVWERVREIPNEELWAARCESRAALIELVRAKSQQDRLRRGEQIDYVRAVAHALDPETLTLGFARRLATYKRLFLLVHDTDRFKRIFGGELPVQLLIAGKAHPEDDAGKRTLERVYQLKRTSDLADRVIVLEDYDLYLGRRLVTGCDVWVNLPRRPMEASGTSGMKATFNGALQLSVLDGWWAEGFDGSNGWAIPGTEAESEQLTDAHDATRFYDLLEHEVVPLFYERDEHGVPQRWCDRIKHALVSCAPAFSATRMINDYVERVYPAS